jgi:hypothetical protein
MTEHATRQSFIVRIYRYDPEDCRRVTGNVEAVDGSGAATPFTSTDELCQAMARTIERHSVGPPPGGPSKTGTKASRKSSKPSGGAL